MSLPAGQLAKSSVEVNGEQVEIRSLSRKEALHMKAIAEDLEACEVWLLQCGTGASAEEVDAFRQSTAPQAVDDLVEAIAKLSGLMPADPKAP